METQKQQYQDRWLNTTQPLFAPSRPGVDQSEGLSQTAIYNPKPQQRTGMRSRGECF